MADEIKPKEGKEFWEFVRKTAEEVSTWPECKRAALAQTEAGVAATSRWTEPTDS